MYEAPMKIFEMLIFPGFLFVGLLSLVYEWIDRKFYAKLQNRVGPLYAGPWGFLQPLADIIKLLSKEDIMPEAADRILFVSAPILALSLMLTAILLLPITGTKGVLSFDGDIIVAVALLTLYTIVVYVAGQASVSRFPSIGSERAAVQLLGYEIPLMLSVVSVVIGAGTLRISDIVAAQSSRPFILGPQLLGFIIYVVAMQAELERVPFDIPEAEQEIVAGWITEYSGRKLALFRLSKDLELVFASGLAAALYLGGPLGPAISGLEPALYLLYFIVKTIFVLLLFTTIRAIFARLRIDQLLEFSWKMLIPLSVLLVLVTRLVV